MKQITIDDDQYLEAAKALKTRDGDLEIDEDATVSRGGDPGVYVQAWVWIADEDVLEHMGLDPEEYEVA